MIAVDFLVELMTILAFCDGDFGLSYGAVGDVADLESLRDDGNLDASVVYDVHSCCCF
jgi:hypothetical protein